MQTKYHLWISKNARDLIVHKPSKDERLKECFIQTKMFVGKKICEKITAHPDQKCCKSQGCQHCHGGTVSS